LRLGRHAGQHTYISPSQRRRMWCRMWRHSIDGMCICGLVPTAIGQMSRNSHRYAKAKRQNGRPWRRGS
jgi:hypothetical protein